MAVPTAITDLSATAGSNSPAGTESIAPNLDDYLRAAFAFIRQGYTRAADVASATTTDIGAAVGLFVNITGTTTITGLGTVGAGVWRVCTFAGALTLTHNASSLILPGAANITTAAGDSMVCESLGSGNWKVHLFQRASGYPVAPTIASGTYTPTLTNVGNISSSTLTDASYQRIGSIVNVCVRAAVTHSALDTQTYLGISLPVASSFTSAADASGVVTLYYDNGGNAYADATNDRLEATWRNAVGDNTVVVYAMYEIK